MNHKSILEQISTKPNKESYKWAGREFSLLSAILLFLIWGCRVLSLLQMLKFAYRTTIQLLKKTGVVDNKSGRPNVPPILCEIYYLVWLIIFVIIHHYPMEIENFWISIIACYYLFESVVWVLYYTVFRRFFEAGYSIFHELEYLTVLFLVIPTQALSLAFLYNLSFRDTLQGLLGAGGDRTPFPIVVLGTLFGAIVISMIISTFPTEAIKKVRKQKRVFIIGNGDVVKNRLKPALERNVNVKQDAVQEYDLLEEEKEIDCKKVVFRIVKEIKKNSDKNSIVWIATPTYTHVQYMESFLNTDTQLIVVEKPVASNKIDIDRTRNLITAYPNRKRVFFLSYYILEKALPLYYLVCNNPVYEKYLKVDNVDMVNNWRLMLGDLRSIKVEIHESEDLRDWVYNNNYGGQLLETFLHNVIVASVFCGSPKSWEVEKYKNETDLDRHTSIITLDAKKNQVSIRLEMSKNIETQQKKRGAILEFEFGQIEADFEEQVAIVKYHSKEYSVGIKDEYTSKYSVQVDLVNRTFEGECMTYESDGLLNQLDIIEWLLEINEN